MSQDSTDKFETALQGENAQPSCGLEPDTILSAQPLGDAAQTGNTPVEQDRLQKGYPIMPVLEGIDTRGIIGVEKLTFAGLSDTEPDGLTAEYRSLLSNFLGEIAGNQFRRNRIASGAILGNMTPSISLETSSGLTVKITRGVVRTIGIRAVLESTDGTLFLMRTVSSPYTGAVGFTTDGVCHVIPNKSGENWNLTYISLPKASDPFNQLVRFTKNTGNTRSLYDILSKCTFVPDLTQLHYPSLSYPYFAVEIEESLRTT